MNGQPRFTRYLKKSRNTKGRNKQTTTEKKQRKKRQCGGRRKKLKNLLNNLSNYKLKTIIAKIDIQSKFSRLLGLKKTQKKDNKR